MPGETLLSNTLPSITPRRPVRAPYDPASGIPPSHRLACRLVRQMVDEMTSLVGDRSLLRRDRRGTAGHIRQITMYVCHVALGMPMVDVGACFGRDRSTVGYACQIVEDRRDDPAFDAFLNAVERLAESVFVIIEAKAHE